jgi:hypothetical protein
MVPKNMSDKDLEEASDQIAEAVDGVPNDKRVLFLGKLTLVLANMVGDTASIKSAINAALRDL